MGKDKYLLCFQYASRSVAVSYTHLEISEKQISGRTITLRIDYADILHAAAFTE